MHVWVYYILSSGRIPRPTLYLIINGEQLMPASSSVLDSARLMSIRIILAFIALSFLSCVLMAQGQARVRVLPAAPTIEIQTKQSTDLGNVSTSYLTDNRGENTPNFQLTTGQTANFKFVARNATACQVGKLDDGEDSVGTSLESNFSIGPEHRWYPALGKTSVIYFSCIDSNMNVTAAKVNISRR